MTRARVYDPGCACCYEPPPEVIDGTGHEENGGQITLGIVEAIVGTVAAFIGGWVFAMWQQSTWIVTNAPH